MSLFSKVVISVLKVRIMAVLVKICTQWNAKRFLCLVTALTVVTVCWYMTNSVEKGPHKLECPQISNYETLHRQMEAEAMDTESTGSYEPLFQSKIVHLDLKGAPPKLAYFAEIFPLIKKLGATGILMEYEDMFPFSGLSLDNSPAHNAYTPLTISKINQLAKENHLEIIPLIQTFGHLEFLLKLPEHVHLREVPDQPQVGFLKILKNIKKLYISLQ